jgi:hypothetical protein
MAGNMIGDGQQGRGRETVHDKTHIKIGWNGKQDIDLKFENIFC